MPVPALSTWSAKYKVWFATAAIAMLAVVIVLGNPFAGRAKATTIPIVFPLEIRVPVLHDYLAPRTGHLHQGTDLMCPKMTKELAAVSGIVTLRTDTYNGLPAYTLWLAGDDGHGYFYIHINNDTPGTDDGKGGVQYAYAPGLTNGTRVHVGDVIGYAGDSGNAEDCGSQLHFEIHLGGYVAASAGQTRTPSAIDPYASLMAAPTLSEWNEAGRLPFTTSTT